MEIAQLNTHINNIHDLTTRNGDNCGKPFIEKRKVNMQKESKHEQTTFMCSNCENKFLNENETTNHNKYQGTKQQICKYYKKGYCWKGRQCKFLQKTIQCEQGGINYACKEHMSPHNKIQEGKRLSCGKCGKLFTNK